jgi:hypothetical protein
MKVAGDNIIAKRGTTHRKNVTVNEFVPDRRLFLEAEILLDGHPLRV